MKSETTMLYASLAFIAAMLIVLIITGLKAAGAPEPLSYDDKFTKAQFCVQTYRLPVMYATKVVCLSHTGIEEEAP